MAEKPWRINDSFPSSLAQQFDAVPGQWSGVVFWSLFEQAFAGGAGAVDVTVVITGLALGALQLGDESVRGDASTAAAGLALGGVTLGDETATGTALVAVSGFSIGAALGDESVRIDVDARPSGLATGDVATGAISVTGDARSVLGGFSVPVSLGDEEIDIDAVATVAGMAVNTVAVSDVACVGDCNATVLGLSTGAIASGEAPVEDVVAQPPSLWGAVRRMFGGSDVIRERNARVDVGRGFVVAVELGRVRVTVEQSRSAIASVAGNSAAKVKLGLVTAAGEDNVTDEELLLILAAA